MGVKTPLRLRCRGCAQSTPQPAQNPTPNLRCGSAILEFRLKLIPLGEQQLKGDIIIRRPHVGGQLFYRSAPRGTGAFHLVLAARLGLTLALTLALAAA